MRSVALNYYRLMKVYAKSLKLVRLSKYSLDAALKEKHAAIPEKDTKDLPNMSLNSKDSRGEWGLRMYGALRILGANVLVATAAATVW